MKLKRGDWLLIAGVLAAAVIGLAVLWLWRTPGTTAVVLVDGVETARYPLDIPADILLTGEGGTNRLMIADGRAAVTEADCPDKVCVQQGGISYQGETVVCLPHRLVIRIEGGHTAAPDITA